MKKLLWVFLVLLILLVTYVYIALYPQLPVANGYAAKKMCSCSFIAGRTQESIQSEDLGISPLSLTSTTIDRDGKYATSTFLGLAPRTAIFRGGAGCILLQGVDNYNIQLDLERPILDPSDLWPLGNRIETYTTDSLVDRKRLEASIDRAFDSSRRMDSLKTRAVVIVHEGRIVSERYAEGYGPETAILGWSMTKSITSTMIAKLIKNGKLSLDQDQLFEEWKDDRSTITLRDLLQMQSGLEFGEKYDALSDATRMLFMTEDVSSIPLDKPLIYEPGTHWAYSSGTTNLLSRLIRGQFDHYEDYLRFPYDSIFTPLGMSSAVMETDESGTFIASSYSYASPRDWARFGLLYLNHGNWMGQQIIDSSWVDFVSTPASDGNGVYGGHFWLNANNSAYPDAPADLFSCNGFEGQRVFIIPSYDLVIVRMGLAEEPIFDFNLFLSDILGCFKPSPSL